jgi:hypothetical protein
VRFTVCHKVLDNENDIKNGNAWKETFSNLNKTLSFNQKDLFSFAEIVYRKAVYDSKKYVSIKYDTK